MLTCPMCKKRLRGLERQCLSCKADVSLLVDYVDNLQEGLSRAEGLTRAGELGEAVWAYLQVLEVDPDNATARRQVGKVVTAVRQFDTTAPGRRWLNKLHKQKRWRRRLVGAAESGGLPLLLGSAAWFGLVLIAFLIGYIWGAQGNPPAPPSSEPPSSKIAPASSKKPPQSVKPHDDLGKPKR
jgi:hypothetical protein